MYFNKHIVVIYQTLINNNCSFKNLKKNLSKKKITTKCNNYSCTYFFHQTLMGPSLTFVHITLKIKLDYNSSTLINLKLT